MKVAVLVAQVALIILIMCANKDDENEKRCETHEKYTGSIQPYICKPVEDDSNEMHATVKDTGINSTAKYLQDVLLW